MKRFLIVSLLFFPTLTFAQAQPQQQPRQFSASPLNWSVDLIINNYVHALGANYKLSPEQEEYTRGLLAQRVKRFLGENEKDIRVLAAEMLDYRTKGEVPPPEIAKEWGERVKQLLPAIRTEIMEGNAKWREILNDDQKKMHDRDLEALDKQFDSWGQMIDRWADGNISPADLDQPGKLSRRPSTVRASEDAWEFFVRRFIQMYSLDESQQQSANSILRESKEQAQHYRESHKIEFADLDAADKAAAQTPVKADPEEIKKMQAESRQRMDRRRDLEKPISDMFTRLKERLDGLPTVEQRQSREMRMEKLASIGKRPTSRPAIAIIGSSQPASAPAEASTQP